MTLFTSASPRQASWGLLLLRVVLGGTFAAHGAQKFFVFGIPGATQFFQSVGIPMPGVMAAVVAALELLGGFALVLGMLSRIVALGLAMDMLVAILLVKLKGGFFSPDGMELELMLMGAALALFLTGPGQLSVDERLLGRRRVR